MRRTGFPLPTALAIAGAVLGWLLEVGLAATGRAALVPPYSLAILRRRRLRRSRRG